MLWYMSPSLRWGIDLETVVLQTPQMIWVAVKEFNYKSKLPQYGYIVNNMISGLC